MKTLFVNDHLRLHIYPHEKGWAIFLEGQTRPRGVFMSADDALHAARKIFKNIDAEVVVHNKMGEKQYMRA